MPQSQNIKKILYHFLGESNYKKIMGYYKAREIESRKWFDREIEIIKFAIDNDESAVDIGANFGLYSYYIGKYLGKGQYCYAFEPIPYTYDILKRVKKHLRMDNVAPVNLGVGQNNETVNFLVPIQNAGMANTGLSHINTGNNEVRKAQKDGERYTNYVNIPCQIVKLDDYLPKNIEIGLVKLDIEGAELFALRGADGVIKRCYPTIICEISQDCLEVFNLRKEDIANYIIGLGYKMYKLDTRLLILNEIKVDWKATGNFIFIHESKMTRFQEVL